MEEIEKDDNLGDLLKDYTATHLELLKMQSIEKIVIITPVILSGTLISLIIYLSVLFLSIGLSIYLSTLLNSTFYGFLIVGSFYLLVGVIFIVSRKTLIIKPLQNILIRAIFKEPKPKQS